MPGRALNRPGPSPVPQCPLGNRSAPGCGPGRHDQARAQGKVHSGVVGAILGVRDPRSLQVPRGLGRLGGPPLDEQRTQLIPGRRPGRAGHPDRGPEDAPLLLREPSGQLDEHGPGNGIRVDPEHEDVASRAVVERHLDHLRLPARGLQVRREDVRNMSHRLTGHAHNSPVLVCDTDKDQATVQVGHRCRALGDRRSAAALLEVDGQRLGSCHGHQVPDPFEGDISGGAVEQGSPGGHRPSISHAHSRGAPERSPVRGSDAYPLRRNPFGCGFPGPASWST